MSSHKQGPYGALKCGCTISRDWGKLGIDYCDCHGAAPELLEAAKAMFEPGAHGFDMLRSAIDKAGGK